MPGKILILHNIMWSRYKAEVFSSLASKASIEQLDIEFWHFSETEKSRASLGGVDYSKHNYEYNLLSSGHYEDLKMIRILSFILSIALRRNLAMVVMPGYSEWHHWLLFILLKIRGAKIGVFCDSTINDNPRSGIKEYLKKFIFRRVDAVFAYGKRSAEYVTSYGVKASKVYEPCHAAEQIEGKVCLESKVKNEFLYVGRMSKEKNLSILINAWEKTEIYRNGGKLYMVGAGPEEAALRSFSESLGVGSSIIFTGSLTKADLAERYSSAEFFILPSLSEPWGLVVNEAMNFGCIPLVSEKCGCIPELVESHEYSKSFDPENIDDIRQTLAYGANLKPRERLIGHHRSKEIVEKFTPDNAASEIIIGIKRGGGFI